MICLDKVLETLDLDLESKSIINCVIDSAKLFYGQYCTHIHSNDSKNVHGETQKRLDLLADNIFVDALSNLETVGLICSEERDDPVFKDGSHAVCFDPLDGSSVIEANFATGSVFGVYPSVNLLGLKPRKMTCAFYFVYGPNLCLNITDGKLAFSGKYNGVDFDFAEMKPLNNHKILAPGNFSVLQSQKYLSKINKLTNKGLSLRYSGALVSDVHMVFVSGGGLFVRPSLETKKPKLRLLYECAPLALFAEALGGSARNETENLLDLDISDYHQTVDLFIGNTDLVDEFLVVE